MIKQKKEKDNRGFSLVELIIVVSIMSILVGILAPQFVKYVEKSRESTCLYNRDTLLTECNVELINDAASNHSMTADGIIYDVLVTQHGMTQNADGTFSGVCQSGGTYQIVKTIHDGQTVVSEITCSHHAGSTDSDSGNDSGNGTESKPDADGTITGTLPGTTVTATIKEWVTEEERKQMADGESIVYSKGDYLLRDGKYYLVINDKSLSKWDSDNSFNGASIEFTGKNLTTADVGNEWVNDRFCGNISNGDTYFDGTDYYMYIGGGNNTWADLPSASPSIWHKLIAN